MGLIRRLLFDLHFFFYGLGHSANHFLVKPPKQIKHVLQMSSSSQTNTNSLVIIHTLTHCALQTQNVHRTKTFSVRKVKKTQRFQRSCALVLDKLEKLSQRERKMFVKHYLTLETMCGAKQGVPKKVSGECVITVYLKAILVQENSQHKMDKKRSGSRTHCGGCEMKF